MSWDVPWPDGGPQVPGLLSPICPGMSCSMSRDVPWPDGGPQVPGLLSPICPGMSWDVPWPDGGPQVPGLLSPICPGTSWDVPSQAYGIPSVPWPDGGPQVPACLSRDVPWPDGTLNMSRRNAKANRTVYTKNLILLPSAYKQILSQHHSSP